MEYKSFFKKRSPGEMQELLKMRRVFNQRSLVEKINELDPKEGIILQVFITPGRFFVGSDNAAVASRRNYKHGDLIPIDQPRTRESAYEYPYIPLNSRMSAMDRALRDRREDETNFIGITWQPVQGNDRRWRVVPFDVPLAGVKLYDYSAHQAGPIQVNDTYTNSARIKTEGAKMFCTVPSMEVSSDRYRVTLEGIPILHGREASAIVLGLKSHYEEGKEPERVTYLHHLRYEKMASARNSDVFVFGPHDVAAYLAVIRKYWHGMHNTVPLTYNPFPLPSRQHARFSDKLDNNVLIYDPTLASKEKLRNLHLNEKCILLGRHIKVMGPWETIFWDLKRDGQIKDYWQ